MKVNSIDFSLKYFTKREDLSMVIKILNANPYGMLSADFLSEFESEIGIVLPKDYRQFLLQNNGGKPVPDFFWIDRHKDGSRVCQFYGLHSESRVFSLRTCTRENRFGIPSSMLPIGDDGMGNYLCLGISADNLGWVFFLDHDLHPYDNPESMIGIRKLANSFTGFLNNLEKSPE